VGGIFKTISVCNQVQEGQN